MSQVRLNASEQRINGSLAKEAHAERLSNLVHMPSAQLAREAGRDLFRAMTLCRR